MVGTAKTVSVYCGFIKDSVMHDTFVIVTERVNEYYNISSP